MTDQLSAELEAQALASMEESLEQTLEWRLRHLDRATDDLAQAERALTAFTREGTVPPDAARHVWIRLSDDATAAGCEVVYDGADRLAYDEARAAQDATGRWLRAAGLVDDDELPTGPPSAADEESGRRRVEEHLRTAVAEAHVQVADAQSRVVAAQEDLRRFRTTRRLSAEEAQEAWSRVAGEVGAAAIDYLEGRATADRVDELKAVRDLVLRLLRAQGHRIDTDGMIADIPR
ncbi:hypothetical protein [Actinomadura opuntiae]|uniref:hypothetical protein n=1 Tax=Actinomadura sp. OS1-43 TaxID=604315 RepID=UPI00255A8AB7|nr:hypothetical protein [Actinomadura sp. OS1-43]MDL4820952.1 hypothetical protein [Actinomadura sp. OS1-43]